MSTLIFFFVVAFFLLLIYRFRILGTFEVYLKQVFVIENS